MSGTPGRQAAEALYGQISGAGGRLARTERERTSGLFRELRCRAMQFRADMLHFARRRRSKPKPKSLDLLGFIGRGDRI
jgi:hypothetical protein